MKSKKLITTICTTAMIGLLGATTVFAANPTTGADDSANSSGAAKFFFRTNASTTAEMPEWSTLTDEQKAEMKAPRQVKMMNRDGEGLTISAEGFDWESLSEEEKAEMEARKAEMETKMAEIKAQREAQNEKWAALSESQKEEIYALKEQSLELERQTIDKYLELGLMDEQTAADRKAALAENAAELRESGTMPRIGGFGIHLEHGGKARFHSEVPIDAIEAEAAVETEVTN